MRVDQAELLMEGMGYYWRGLLLVMKRPALWPLVVLPGAITLATLVLGLWLSWQAVAVLLHALWTPGSQGATVIWWMAAMGLRATLFILVGVTMYFSAGLIAVPFNDRLSGLVERELLGPNSEEAFSWSGLLGDLWMSLRHSAASLALWLLLMAALVSLNLVPVLGSVAELLLSLGVTSLFLARETMDGCMSRRRFSFLHKLRVIRQNLSICLGFGAVASVMLWVPLVNFVMMPLAVAGGTLLFCHLEQQGLVPPEEPDV